MKAPLTKLAVLMLAALFAAPAFAADPALTIYNQDFAVVRDTVPLDLKSGVNDVHFTETTAHLEPDSVLLRDPSGKVSLQIIEQNYRADPISEELLLSFFEGKTIEFLVDQPNSAPTKVTGKIVRSGYTPAIYDPEGEAAAVAGQPIIEVDGKLRFGLPGKPLFPSLSDDAILKPTICWKIQSDAPAKFDAELAYITGGMSWQADYNLVAPETSEQIDLTGLVTIKNQSGKNFAQAHVKLMAGDVNKIQPQFNTRRTMDKSFALAASAAPTGAVTEKAFDEYHLYSLARTTDLHASESKQVEFVRAEGIPATRIYVYDGAKTDPQIWQMTPRGLAGGEPDFGLESNPKVAVFVEFKNSEENHLGIPLPRGRVRFFRRDSDSQLEFTGENIIDHTPKDETLRFFTGYAFDLKGERTRTNYHDDSDRKTADESFEIKVRNHKKEAVEIRVREHLDRWTNWKIVAASDQWKKLDAQTIEFREQLKPDEEKTVSYTAHYSW